MATCLMILLLYCGKNLCCLIVARKRPLQVLKMMVGNNLKDTQLQQIVDKTILFADKDEDGKISFEEFCNVVGNTDIHKKMVVDV